MKLLKKVFVIFITLLLTATTFTLFSCVDPDLAKANSGKISALAGNKSLSENQGEGASDTITNDTNNDIKETIMNGYRETEKRTDYVQITMENGNTIVIRLFSQYVPITVSNFKDLVAAHFYDGLIFHRVIAGFMIQGGDPKGNGTGGSGKTIPAEFVFELDGQQTIIPHKRGVVSMARGNDPDSASSQFFICHADSPHLNGSYAAFGYVVQGMQTVDEIASVVTDAYDRPLVEQKMRKVTFVDPVE